MDAAPQFDRVWGFLCDDEGNTITRMGVRVGSLGLWTCFFFVQTRDKVSLTSYLTPADTKGVRCTGQESYEAWPQPRVPTLAMQKFSRWSLPA